MIDELDRLAGVYNTEIRGVRRDSKLTLDRQDVAGLQRPVGEEGVCFADG